MRRVITLLLTLMLVLSARAEDGSRLWLRYETVNKVKVSGIDCLAAGELRQYYKGPEVMLIVDASLPEDAYQISSENGKTIVRAKEHQGLLYGAYALLRSQKDPSAIRQGIVEKPFFKYRILNHWDNLDGSIERGYAGRSIFWDLEGDQPKAIDARLMKEYARANASIGINGTVLNNVNASPKMLSAPYIDKVKEIADILRPYGIKVYLSVNFASPMTIPAKGFNGGKPLKTADPLNTKVKAWWKAKAKEIYALIPDFGGFLVKANSEGQPGPFDYKRTHADGANTLAEALKPFGGIVMWRSFVYGAAHKGEDRVKQAVSEFKDLDGKFLDNVILQSKNGPLDFQPREPYAPIFDNMRQTSQMAELQITQEYLGQSRHLVYLAPMWREFFGFVAPKRLVGIAGVANIGLDKNWCGHHFSQANWYAFGRLAWDPFLPSETIAQEWLKQTFDFQSPTQGEGVSDSKKSVFSQLLSMMLRSREACVDYMMPLGLHHIFAFDHHYGPEPGGYIAHYPIEWCPVYYHKADSIGVGFDRTHTGSDATSQYREPFCSLYDDINTCPERYLLWFHHVPWDYRLKSGNTLWEELQERYARGVKEVEDFISIWQEARTTIDLQRWKEVDERLQHQLENAQEWQKSCLDYFGSFVKK
ncbi:MAG: alpha-glucuronidase [Prevotella sp.]|nr:alpha-glucuronidase [Prevotella sp.]